MKKNRKRNVFVLSLSIIALISSSCAAEQNETADNVQPEKEDSSSEMKYEPFPYDFVSPESSEELLSTAMADSIR